MIKFARKVALGVLAVTALAAGCSRCGGTSGSSSEPRAVERVLGRGAVGVVIVPKVADLGQALQHFEKLKVASFLAPTQGFADSRALVDALVGQLGVDVRSPEALEAAGIDGAGPGGASVLVSGQVYLALPVKDARKLDAAIAALAKRRLGAGLTSERAADQVVVKTYARATGGPPALGYVLARGFALVAVGDGIAGLPAMATLPESDSLAKEPALVEARRRLGGAGQAYVYLPPGSPVLGRLPVTSALVALSLEASAFSLTLDAPLRPGNELGAALERAPTAVELSALLPADAFFVAGYDGAPSTLAPVARQLLGRWLEGSGVDLEADVLAHVRPGVVAALTLAERPPLGRGVPSLQLGRTNPFTYVGLSGVAPLDGADAGVAALQQAVALAPRLGAEMKRQDRGLPDVVLAGRGRALRGPGDARLLRVAGGAPRRPARWPPGLRRPRTIRGEGGLGVLGQARSGQAGPVGTRPARERLGAGRVRDEGHGAPVARGDR